MDLADMTIGEFDTVDPTKQIARDYWSPAYGRPQLDTALGGRDNVLFVSGSSDASSTVYEFERPLAASDAYDKAIRNAPVPIVYAHGDVNQPQLLKHPNAYRAGVILNFYSKGECSGGCGENGFCNTFVDECVCKPGFAPPNCLPIGPVYRYSTELISGFRMEWSIKTEAESTKEVIFIRLVVDGDRWAGISIEPSDDGMEKADMIIGDFDGQGIGKVGDYYSRSYERPSLDTSLQGTNDILSAGAYQVDGQNIYEFSRYLDTGDAAYDKVIKSSGKTTVSFAMGNVGDRSLTKHPLSTTGVKRIDFATGNAEDVDEIDKKQLHAIFMTAGYAIFMVGGIFVARYLKIHILDWWFRLHILLMAIGVLCACIGFGLAINMVKDEHFAYTHSWIGLFTFILSGCQVLLGYLSHHLFDIRRNITPIFPDKLHWWLGRTTIIMAIIAIFLGLDVLEVNDAFYVGFGLVLGFYAIVFGYMEYTWSSPDPHTKSNLLGSSEIGYVQHV